MFSKVFIFAFVVASAFALKDFPGQVSSDGIVVMIFERHGCPYSDQQELHFVAAEKDNTFSNMSFMRVFCDADHDNLTFCRKNNVHKYPRIGAFKNGAFVGFLPSATHVGRGSHAAISEWTKTLA